MLSPVINLSVLESLSLPHEMPSHHRIRTACEGGPVKIIKGKRPGAHQEKELMDINIALEGLIACVMGMYKIISSIIRS